MVAGPIGNTTACVAFIKAALPELGSAGHMSATVQAMMITRSARDYAINEPYGQGGGDQERRRCPFGSC